MPQKIKQEDGNEIEVYTAEELEAAKTGAVDEYKTANPPEEKKEETVVTPAPATGEPTIADAMKAIEGLTGQLRQKDIQIAAVRYAGADPEKQKTYETAFGQLKGFEATPEGFEAHAAAAARLAFGTDQPAVDVGSFAAVVPGVTPNSQQQQAQSEADKGIQKALGISPEMVKVYGPGGEKNPETKSN